MENTEKGKIAKTTHLQEAKASIANPEAYFDQSGELKPLPGLNAQKMILKAGSEEKINWLLTLKGLHVEAAKDHPDEVMRRQYFAKIKSEKQEGPAPTQDQLFNQLRKYYAKVAPGVRKADKPDFITHEFVKAAFWELYKNVVYRETGLERPIMNGNRKETLANIIHWFNGDIPQYDNKGLPLAGGPQLHPDKSLYLYGPRGLGKTSIVEALSLLGGFMKRKGWKARAFDFYSMEEIYFGAYGGKKDVDVLSFMNGNLILDELSERHLSLKHYGTDLNFAADLLIGRHNAWKRERVQTIITTNLTPQALAEELNDPRLMDRIYQQFEFWQVTGENLR